MWDSGGKMPTGTIQGFVDWGNNFSRSVVSVSLRPHGLQSARFLCPWDSPGKNTGMGTHFLLQGIFPTQGSNIALQADSLPSGPPGKPHRDWGKLRAK